MEKISLYKLVLINYWLLIRVSCQDFQCNHIFPHTSESDSSRFPQIVIQWFFVPPILKTQKVFWKSTTCLGDSWHINAHKPYTSYNRGTWTNTTNIYGKRYWFWKRRVLHKLHNHTIPVLPKPKQWGKSFLTFCQKPHHYEHCTSEPIMSNKLCHVLLLSLAQSLFSLI